VPAFRRGQFDLVCIGSSTGGPPVLETLIGSLPPTFDTPIVIAQHMPELFTRSMATRLNDMCSQSVHQADEGKPIHKRSIYIAPGGSNTQIVKQGLARHRLYVGPEPLDAVYKPSVNALFSSAAAASGSRTLAIVLTGIGDDGMLGARDLHAKGGIILAQSEPTCVVYGMPKAVASANLAKACLTPAELGRALASLAGAPAAAA
jgi:two-component system chemotaxis response regulator CheB